MKQDADIEIVRFRDEYAPAFARLNREWLEGFGLLEPADAKHLESPRASIIERGGEVLLALAGADVVGTCALIPVDPTTVELAKLSVAPHQRGHGIGRRLTLAAIELAGGLGAQRVVLCSNSQLVAAIRLYERLGFRHTPSPDEPSYASADVYMELPLPAATAAR